MNALWVDHNVTVAQVFSRSLDLLHPTAAHGGHTLLEIAETILNATILGLCACASEEREMDELRPNEWGVCVRARTRTVELTRISYKSQEKYNSCEEQSHVDPSEKHKWRVF